MRKDPYKILGVASTSTAAEIESAYRKIAKRKHPDRHPGNADVVEEFKEITAAYTLLSNQQERAKYDQMQSMGSSGDWANNFTGGYNTPFGDTQYGDFGSQRGGRWSVIYDSGDFSGASASPEFAHDFGGGGTIEDIIKKMFGVTMRSPNVQPRKGKDFHIEISLTFFESVLGVKKTIRLPGGKVINANIPAGAVAGQRVKLSGLGEKSAIPGDLYLELQVSDHKNFQRKGYDIYVNIPLSMKDGNGKLVVPTIHGDVKIDVANRKKLEVIRLKEKGIKTSKCAGDQYVTLM